MGYKMYEITSEKKTEIMEHAEKAYEHVGKLLECIEEMSGQGVMGQRDGDGWYIRQLERKGYGRDGMGYRDMDEDYRGGYMGERRMGRGRYGMREEYPYYHPY